MEICEQFLRLYQKTRRLLFCRQGVQTELYNAAMNVHCLLAYRLFHVFGRHEYVVHIFTCPLTKFHLFKVHEVKASGLSQDHTDFPAFSRFWKFEEKNFKDLPGCMGTLHLITATYNLSPNWAFDVLLTSPEWIQFPVLHRGCTCPGSRWELPPED